MKAAALKSKSIPWAIRALDGALVLAHRGRAEEEIVTLMPLAGAAVLSLQSGQQIAQSGACCPSGSCCASGSCCQSYSACPQMDDEAYGARALRGEAATTTKEKRLWPIPV